MMNSTSFGKKIAAAALAALTMGSAVTMSAGSAEARDGRKGALIAAGVLGALAVGAIAAQANESRHGYYVDDGYAADDVYAPAYRQPRTVYQQPVQYYRPMSRIRVTATTVRIARATRAIRKRAMPIVARSAS